MYEKKSRLEELTEILSKRKSKRKINSSTNIVLLDSKDNFYLGTRTDLPKEVLEHIISSNKGLKWTNAGGGIEFDESPEQGIIRELEEEFGVKAYKQTGKIVPLSFNDCYYVKNGFVNFRRDFSFITRLKNGVTVEDMIPQDGEIGEIQCFTKKEVINMIERDRIYRSSQNALMTAIRNLHKY